VGNGWPAIYDELRQVARENGLSSDDVVFFGRVSDEDLVGLYNLCRLFVFPPLWEGLGLPVLEAMACGAPVVGSNTTSIPEVLGWDQAEFDPEDVGAIAEKITSALTDETFYEALKVHALEHIKGFTWPESARRSLAAIRQAHDKITKTPESDNGRGLSPRRVLADLVATEKLPAAQVWEIACCLAMNERQANAPTAPGPKIKLGWVSSWAQRCGIASYSENLLRHFDGEVHVLGSHRIIDPTVEMGRVYRCWSQGKSGDLTELSAHIDDLDLTDIMIQFNYGFFNFEALAKLIEDQVLKGRRIYVTLHSTNDALDAPGHRLSELRLALTLCRGIVVHADRDIRRLESMGVTANVIKVPQGVRLIDTDSQVGPRRRIRIASYGFFLPGKGLPELVEALSLVRRRGHDIELRMVNANYGDAEGLSQTLIANVQALTESLGVADHVEIFSEYLDDSESLDLLRDADLIVYAYQSTGESSSAAVRMGLASGVPVAVTPLKIFDDVVEATFSLPGLGAENLATGIIEALDQLATGSDLARATASAAAAWCASHDVRGVARYLARFIDNEASTDVALVVLSPDTATIPIRDAVRKGATIQSSGAEGGLLCYGPYVTLGPGLYCLEIKGAATGDPDRCAAKVEVTANFAQSVLESFDVYPVQSEFFLRKMVRISKKIEHAEVVVKYNPGATVSVEGYKLIKNVDFV
jgi:glycosyltransferase involved in cell wall biosynthesis